MIMKAMEARLRALARVRSAGPPLLIAIFGSGLIFFWSKEEM